MTDIYTEIGGHDALVAVVDDFYRRVLDDPELAGFFQGANMSRLKGKQVEFFTAALGGPDAYSGLSMKDAHRGRGIGSEHFEMVVKYLTESLLAAGVPEPTTEAITAALAPLSADIVARSGV